jgi:dihydrofolate reductase
MGRLTYNSIGKPLPDRKNIVLSRNLKDERVIVTDNLNESLEKFKHEKEVFIIGGEDIYRQTISLINKLYLTTIEDVIEGDKYFPVIDISKWELIEKTIYKKDESNSHNFKTEVYVKNF